MPKLGAGRGTLRFNQFRDHEMDWVFRRVMTSIIEHGAEIGECLYAASRIDGRDAESWICEWSALASRLEQQAEQSLRGNHHVSARESFLRASTYYRAAEYLCEPAHPRFHELWKKSHVCFQKACPLFDPPITIIKIPYQGKYLPGYFWRPADDDRSRPTYVSVGGNDDSGEEVFFWDGFAAVRRGYNYFTFEYPGHRGTVHLYPELIKQEDYEIPFDVAFDYLETLPGVNGQIALAGYSHGGYTVSRVAVHDSRVDALIPSTPLIDAIRAGKAVFGPVLKLIPSAWIDTLLDWKIRNSPATKSLIYYMVWTMGQDTISGLLKGIDRGEITFSIEGEVDQIDCPVICLVGEGEGRDLIDQTEEFYQQVGSDLKTLKMFSLEVDGSDDHCQLDNRSRANQVVFDWLDELFLDIRDS